MLERVERAVLQSDDLVWIDGNLALQIYAGDTGGCEKYFVRIPYAKNWQTGEVRYREVFGNSRQELLDRINSFLILTPAQMELEEEGMRIGDWFAEWMELSMDDMESSTAKLHTDIFEEMIGPYFRDADIRYMHADDFLEWVDLLRLQGFMEHKISMACAIFRGLLRSACIYRLIPYSPFPGMKFVRPAHPVRKILTAEQRRIIRENQFFYPKGSLCAMLVCTGGRVSEIVALQAQDCLPDGSMIRLHRQFSPSEGADGRDYVLKDYLKNRKERVVELPGDGAKLVRYLLQRVSSMPEKLNPNRFLLVDSNGMPFTGSAAAQILAQMLEDTGSDVTPHDTRRTYATDKYQQTGRNLKKVSDDLFVTAKTAMRYILQSPEGLKQAALAIEGEIAELSAAGDEPCGLKGDKVEKGMNEMQTGSETMTEEVKMALRLVDPYLEIRGNFMSFSSASVGCLSDAEYIALHISADRKDLVVRKVDTPGQGLPFSRYKEMVKGDKYTQTVTWYVEGIALSLESILKEGWNLERGVRLHGTYEPQEKALHYDLSAPVQMQVSSGSAGGEAENSVRKRRGRKKKIQMEEMQCASPDGVEAQ